MSVQAQVPADHPLMIAWNRYTATEEAQLAERWAKSITVRASGADGAIYYTLPHLDGMRWAAFMAGYQAAGGQVSI